MLASYRCRVDNENHCFRQERPPKMRVFPQRVFHGGFGSAGPDLVSGVYEELVIDLGEKRMGATKGK